VRAAHGAPSLHLHNAAQQRANVLGWAAWSVSLSHDSERAIAFVVAMTGNISPPPASSPLALPDQ
jgi:phosphopantetheinyl transferase (holo-ACP synthase)